MTTSDKAAQKSVNLGVLANYALIVLSGFCIGYGASSFLIGVGVVLGLTAIYRPAD